MPPSDDSIDAFLHHILREDIGKGDITTALSLPEGTTATLVMRARVPMVVCGMEYVKRLFLMLDEHISLILHVKDSQKVEAGTVLCTGKGNAYALLAGERSALNLVQHLSGIATLTHSYVEAIKGTKARILDTRKTTPGLREVQKYAVTCGGGHNHRMRLDDGILIKDNHIALGGGIRAVLEAAKSHSPGMRIEVECDTLEQVKEALEHGADMLLLDNMDINTLTQAVALCRGNVPLEASGNVTLETVRAIAETGVDFISIGRLTHSAPAVDIGLDIG